MTIDARDARTQDEETRERIRAMIDVTLFVEAGAGTGKTRALVEQIVALVLAGRPIDRIVAITFTEKAAGELKDRVRSALDDARAAMPEHAAVIDEAMRSLDRAQISTIHAFGLALLRNFAAESGIDPAFVVQDEVLAERRLQERWRSYLEATAAPEAVAAVDRALGLGMTTRDFWTLAQELARRPGLAAQLEAEPLVAPAVFWPDLEAMAAPLRALPLETVLESDELRIRAGQMLALVERIARGGPDREAALAAGASTLTLKFGVGRADNWGGSGAKTRAKDAAEHAKTALNDLLARCRSEALAAVLPLIVRFVLEDTLVRAREGTLIFDDLILGPRDLFVQVADAARALRARYDVMLIDEFQDTDPLQVDIALAFGTDPATGLLEPGRLFLVGDPKQSIYRFRRADMAIYAATGNRVKSDGGSFPALSLNRRSRGVIVEWVNRAFDNIIGAGDQPDVQPPYREIYAEREDDLAGPGVALIGNMSDEPASQIRLREAAAIAAQCRAALDDGWQVAARGGGARPASFRDIAILIPTRMVLMPLERALTRAGVPYRVEGGSLIYQTQEVRDLLNCLTAIDDPADEVAVVGALRSAAFACTDVEIARHRAEGGRFDYQAHGLAEREGAVADALRTLAAYHDERHQTSIAALVERFAGAFGLAELGVIVDASRDSFRRMRFVIEQARAFEANGPESLRSFVSWMEQRAGKDILDNEGAALDDDEDAVRVLTIHRAKGLEFPIVFVAGLSAAPSNRKPVFCIDAADGRVGVAIGAKTRNARFVLGDVTALHALEHEHANAEYDRLLYVAATRARDHLILSMYHSKKATRCLARRLMEGLAALGVAPLPERQAVQARQLAPFADLTVEAQEALTDDAFAIAREALVAGGRRQQYTSATALGPSLGPLGHEAAQDETEPWARGRGGTHVGRAVHATIQSVPLDAAAEQIDAFARAQSVAEAIPGRAGDVAELVHAALASEAAARARGSARALREVPFAVTYGDTVLEGFIDMVIEGAGGELEIVDWKTDRVAEQDVPARLSQYALQAGLYVLGLEAATGRRVGRVTYVFASAGVEASPGEPSALAAAAAAHLPQAHP